jgi:hypothetical protein
MDMTFQYRQKSRVEPTATGVSIALSTNVRRDRVSFHGQLNQPVRFREAISALHDVVICDLRYEKPDKSAYQAYLAAEQAREDAIRKEVRRKTREELLMVATEPMPPDLPGRFRQCRDRYWKARDQYSRYLSRHDMELWRLMVPCDPIVTVAPDIVLFECFSKDESSYGALSVARDAFQTSSDVALGTTNVDYSWELYEQFQTLRSYRNTSFVVDPQGIEVQTGDDVAFREEKIDLPETWLRGFLQLQAAMTLPMRRVRLSLETVYSILAFLQRNRAKKSPRAIRFELSPGRLPRLFLEPWNQEIPTCEGANGQTTSLGDFLYQGPREESVRIWGRDRLHVLRRLLPLADYVDVGLIGNGFPSFWVVSMGDMKFTLGLSGWTTNDWSGLVALDQLAPPGDVSDSMLETLASSFVKDPRQSFPSIQQSTNLKSYEVAAGLNRLALLGQVIHDVQENVYRWRQVMPTPLTREQLGPPNPEVIGAAELVARKQMKLLRNEPTTNGLRLLSGRWSNQSIEVLVDADHLIVRGKCTCSHHYRFGLKKGPCRHLLALRNVAFDVNQTNSLNDWYKRYWN